jgi:hypothetical protein
VPPKYEQDRQKPKKVEADESRLFVVGSMLSFDRL